MNPDHQQQLSLQGACLSSDQDNQIQLSSHGLSPRYLKPQSESSLQCSKSTHDIVIDDRRSEQVSVHSSIGSGLDSDHVSPVAFQPGRNKGGRPKGKSPASKAPKKQLKGATILRVNRPVDVWVPMDVWRAVFKICKPETLFKLRLVCHEFKDEIKSENVWERSLFLEFGDSLPKPPQGLSYFHYANLLTRHGCQGCSQTGRGQSRRAYWAFTRRYCENCMQQKVIYVSTLRLLQLLISTEVL